MTALALLAATGALVSSAHAGPATATAPAARATRTLEQDFDGDGYEDLAVSAPSATVGGKAKAGYVAVLYGAAGGLRSGTKKVYTQASPGVPGSVEAGDLFGSGLTAADLDGDGFTDLVVEAQAEQWRQDGIDRTGRRTVLWGGPGGLVSGRTLPAEGAGRYQAPMSVTGDFDGDGHQDLARNGLVSFGPFRRDGVPAATQSGADFSGGDLRNVAVAAGDTDGDGTDDLVTVARADDWDDETNYGNYVYYARGGRDGLRAPVELEDLAGQQADSLALGDLDGDGRADLVLGENSLRVLRATADGLPAGAPRVITQDTPGVPGVQEAGDEFGRSVSIGDVDGDGYGDIVAGIPYEDFGALKNAGTFAVLPGGPHGATGAGTRVFSQDAAGVPGTAESGDLFGTGTHLVDGNGDGRAEPVVAALGEDAQAGAVWVFGAASTGATATGSFSFGARTLGTVASGARLGGAFPR